MRCVILSSDFTPRSRKTYLELGIEKDTVCATHRIQNSEDKVSSQVPGVDTILVKILVCFRTSQPRRQRLWSDLNPVDIRNIIMMEGLILPRT